MPCEVSQTAGTFVCNHVLYGLMHLLVRGVGPAGARGGFVHVPWVIGQGTPHLPLRDMVRGIHAALWAAVLAQQDIALQAGAPIEPLEGMANPAVNACAPPQRPDAVCTVRAMSFAPFSEAPGSLNAAATAALLPWSALADEIAALLRDSTVSVPARSVLPLAQGGSLFVMPATDRSVAMTKLITFTPGNAGTGRPSIQGDVVVFDIATGERRLVLDGPTVTARRTAAVSLLAARHLAQVPQGPLLIVGAGVQGRAHAEAFVVGLGVQEVWIASRSAASAEALAAHVHALGAQARVVADADAALPHCPLVATCTPAQGVVLSAAPRPDAFIAAVGAVTPTMVELAPALCQHVALHGTIVVDTGDASHEAGDLLQAGLDVAAMPRLRDVVCGPWAHGARASKGPVLFKSCGWAGWDLAAARLAMCRGAAESPMPAAAVQVPS